MSVGGAPHEGEAEAAGVVGDGFEEARAGRLAQARGAGEGNAFYVEELIRAAADGGDDALPDTVLGMVQARLDALGPEAKKVLRAASVFGEVFWRGGVAALVGEVTSTAAALGRLTASELVSKRNGAIFPGEDEYIFRHALVRETAYAMIPDVDRRAKGAARRDPRRRGGPRPRRLPGRPS